MYLEFTRRVKSRGLGIEKNNEWRCVQVVPIIVYSLIPLLLFGVVETINMVNWDWVTPQPNSLLRKSTICLQSFQWQEDITMHCFLIVKDLSGAVGTMQLVDWDWETQHKETKQKRFKDFLQSNQWQEECIFQCLWTSKAMFV